MTSPRNRVLSARMRENIETEAILQGKGINDKQANSNSEAKTWMDMVTTLIKSLEEQKQEYARQMEEQKQMYIKQRENMTEIFNQQILALKEEVAAMIQTQLSNVQVPTSASPSYAAVARTPPVSQPSNLASLSSANTTPSTFTDTLYCTVDTSTVEEGDRDKAQIKEIRQAIEKEIRILENQSKWRCTAVIKDPRNPARIRVTCRNEEERQQVKKALEKTKAPGARILRDQLYPVKVDNANRLAILERDGSMQPGIKEALGEENEVQIAKMEWLSRKDNGKAYGSMVIWVTKGSDAMKLLHGLYFHIAGESAYVRVYEPRIRPIQCYKCQTIGHKAFSCQKLQVCAKCAKTGHHHSDCLEEIPKCALCGGPHEAFSKNCRTLYPSGYE